MVHGGHHLQLSFASACLCVLSTIENALPGQVDPRAVAGNAPGSDPAWYTLLHPQKLNESEMRGVGNNYHFSFVQINKNTISSI
jgi:hypothetical protein